MRYISNIVLMLLLAGLLSAQERYEQSLDRLVEQWAAESYDNDCAPLGPSGSASDSVYRLRLYALPFEVEMPFNTKVKNCIETYVVRRASSMPYLLGLSHYYFPIFERYLNAYGLPLELENLPVIESALNPQATSPAGAGGLWQFMPATGKMYGLEINSLVDERRDPWKASDAACRMLRDLYGIYHNWHLVIAAYNCGPGNVNKAIARAGGRRDFWAIYNYLPEETRNYVPMFIGACYATNYYAQHAICPKNITALPVIADTVMISENLSLNQVAQVLDIPLLDIQRLNPTYRRNIIPGSRIHKYPLCLPLGELTHYMIYSDSVAKYKAQEFLSRRDSVPVGLQTVQAQAPADSVAPSAPSAPVTKTSTPKPPTKSSSSSSYHKPSTTYYTVKSGDSLSRIASKYHCTVSDLRRWNGLKSDRLGIGQKLKILK